MKEVREILAGQDLMIVLAIAFFIFGAKRLPEIASGLGKAMRDFKDGLNGMKEKPLKPPLKSQKQRYSKDRKRRQRTQAYRSLDNLPYRSILRNLSESMARSPKVLIQEGGQIRCGRE